MVAKSHMSPADEHNARRNKWNWKDRVRKGRLRQFRIFFFFLIFKYKKFNGSTTLKTAKLSD